MESLMDSEDMTGMMVAIMKDILITGIDRVRARCSKLMERTTKVNPLVC